MKVLLFEWPSITNKEMAAMLTKFGCTVYVLRIPFKSFTGDTELCEKFEEYLKKEHFDLAFSINYFDMIAEACHNQNVKYVAWTYDSPTHMGDLDKLKYETNYVFMFDRTEAERYQSFGFSNVYHLPLAVDCQRYDSVRTKNTKNRRIIQSDISFVGRMYDNDFAEVTATLADYDKAFLNALVDAQLRVSGYNLFNEIIDAKFMERISNPEFNRLMNMVKKQSFLLPTEEEEEDKSDRVPNCGALRLRLNQAVTNRERLLVLQLLAKHHHLKLFSTEKNELIKNAIQCGPVDYYTNMPKVFKYSRINLNISMRSIESGIPLRCLDIMGCGGLLMSNYQTEFDEHFQNGRDLLIYMSPEDALDKANYYLNPRHEEERRRIARNGYEVVKTYYSYEKQLAYIWKVAELGPFPCER